MVDNRIMILGSDEAVCLPIAEYLKESKYSVACCVNYTKALELLMDGKHLHDLIIFDMGIPSREEYELIRKVKEQSDIRMIIISEDDRLESQLYAYSMKIDDYMVKPVPLPLLEAHMEAIFRRNGKRNSLVRQVAALTIDYERRKVFLDGKPIEMTTKEFDLIDYFVNHQGMVLSRDQILDSVWGYDYIGGYRNVDTLVKKIRAKFTEEYPYIRTIYGVGYCFDV